MFFLSNQYKHYAYYINKLRYNERFEELPQNDVKKRIVIQIDNPNQDFNELTKFFYQLGIELDKGYGMIPINLSLHRYVVRGFGNSTARENLKQIEGIKVFSDPDIESHDKGNKEIVDI